jgi:cytochrome bd-type quinol oxidase subunit 2
LACDEDLYVLRCSTVCTWFSGAASQHLRTVLGRNLYNAPTLNLRRAHLIMLAVLVAAFVALYPYLGSMGMCDSGECPQIVHSASSGFSTACLSAVVLVVVPMLLAVTAFGWRSTTSEVRPIEVFSSPDPPPPRPTFSR